MRNLPKVFSQNDPQWQLKPLGDGSADLGQDGCLDTSMAMLACYYGKDTDPLRLDQAFENSGDFVSGDLLTDDDLQKLFPDINYQGSDHYEGVPADLGKLQGYLNDSTISVILCLDMGSGNVHFVVAVDTDGNDKVTIANSWDGKIEDLGTEYGDPKTKILRFIVYKGTPQQQGTYVDAQTFTALVSKATNDDEFVKAGFSNASDVQTKINNLQSTIDGLNKEVGDLTNANTDLKNNIAEVQNQNASMLNQMQKMQNADSTAIDEGLKAEAALKEVTSDINAVASLLNTTYPTIKNILSAIDAKQSEIDTLKKTLPATTLPSEPSTPAQSFDLLKLLKEFFGIKTK